MLFTERSLWTMLHGIGFGGAALMALAAALYALYLIHVTGGAGFATEVQSRAMTRLTTFTAAMIWLTTIVGTLIVFPDYRASPPEGAVDLAQYPRSMLLSLPETAWLHSFAMETKEHLPWIAAMIITATAFVAWRYGVHALRDGTLRRIGATMLSVTFVIVAYVSLLGVFVNKVAPVE